MSPPPTSIDGTDITGATIDGQEVQEITIDGDTVFTAAPDIPNSVVRQYDARNISASSGDPVSTWTDEQGNANLTQGTSDQQPTLQTNIIGSNPVVRFDGSNDEMDDGGALNITEPFAIQWVGQLRTAGGSQAFYGLNSNFAAVFGGTNGGNFQLSDRAGDIDISADDTNAHVFTFLHDNNGSKIRIDQSDDLTGSVTVDDEVANILVVGNRASSRNVPGEWDAGIIFVHDSPTSQQIADGESILSNEYGI
jgi:hypothetical protein